MAQFNYQPGDVIRYRAFDGRERKVKVTARHSDIKNGRAGFEAILIEPSPKHEWDANVWGYDSQIVAVEDR